MESSESKEETNNNCLYISKEPVNSTTQLNIFQNTLIQLCNAAMSVDSLFFKKTLIKRQSAVQRISRHNCKP